MKRLSAIMVCLLSLFIGVVFSACDDGYKKLKMEFDSDKQFVQLILDDEYYNSLQEDVDRKVNHAKILTVEFSGIKAKDIGDLDIQVIPSDLATIEEWILVDKELQFSIYAERSGSGDIVVTHLGSGKELTIPLYVEKKAITAYSKNNSLVVNIPDAVEESGETKETINTITINPDNLMNFDPIDATDIVNWEIVGNAIDGVELINDASAKEGVSIKDESVSDPIDKSEDLKKPITQIQVSSNCLGGTFQIKPTLSRSGYEDIALDWVVNVNIVKVLNENNVKMLSNNAIGELEEDTDNPEYKIISGDITLLRNASNYNIADIKLYNEKTDILSNDSGYLNVYNIKLEKSSDGCFEATLESNDNGLYISVVSFAYSDKMEWVKIHFTPKNAVGNIENFTIQLNLKMSEVASRIDAFVDNIGVESSATANEFIRSIDVELLDYYAKYNNLGQKFNFNVNRTTTDDSLKEMNVKIDLPLISKNNPVYSAEGVLVDMSGAANHGVAGYLLEFRKGGELMKFTLIDGYLVSERFKYSDNIYVKYVRNSDQTAETIQLKFTVSNSYNGAYGEGVIKNTEKSLDIYVSRSRGVRDVEMTGGYIGASDTEGLTTFGTNTLNSLNIMKDNIYTFNQAVSNNLVSEGKMIYGVSIDDVLSGTELTKAEIMEINFDCYLKKDGNKVENVDFAIFSQILNSITLIENSNFKLSLGDNKTFNMIAIFVKEGTTLENGLYEFVLIQRSGGFEKAFSINLVANVNAENILVSPFNKDEMANSKIVYLGENYDGYYADSYIIPTNYNFNTTISTGKTVDGEFVEDETYIPYISSVNVEIMSGKFEGENNFTQTNLISGVEYMNYSTSSLGKINLSGLLTSGNFGTIFEGEICYIQVKFIVESIKYTLENNFYVVSNETNKAEKYYYFFIYVPVSTIDFEESLNVYNYDQLGYYNKNQGIKTLTLNLLNINETSQSVFDYVSYSWAMSETLKNTTMVEDKENHSATFTFRNESQYYHRISVNITQFGSKIPVNCDVYIHDLMLTQDIVVRNSIKNVNNSKIIYLNVGDILKFDVEQLGDFSFYGIKYVVCDVAGKVYSDYRVNDNGELINSDGSKVINKATDFKVIIFSKDWLKLDIDSYSYYNLSDLSQYLINDKFASKVEIIDVKVRDGSVAKPFLLTSSDDIKSLVGTSEKDFYYYELINDINMNNSALNLGEFNGNLSSFKDYQLLEKVPADWAENYNNYYTYSQTLGYVKNSFSNPVSFSYRTYFELKQNRFSIYNIKLSTNENYAFIDNLNENSQISFVTFKVNYDIKLQQFNKENLAVIGENNGELYNVCVEYYGIIVVNSATKPINIGGLVATNNGEIIFNDSSSIASKGSLNINNNSKVALNIGGLVGVNVGTIQGVLPSGVNDSIEYTLFYEHQGSMFGGKIVLSCENSASTLGGVAGINNNGELVNIYTTGELIGYNNVGGIIGKNIIDSPLNSSAGEDNANIKHSLSSTIVLGNDNIGGVVGYDIYGVYYHVYYELYNSNSLTTSAISGNSSVGGLVGWTNLGKFKYCYFYSYRWNYSNLSATNVSFSTSEANNQLLDISGLEFNNSEFYNKVADINAKEKVGGLIGYSVSSPLTDEIDNNRVIVDNSSVNAYITGGNETGGLIGYALEYPRWTNGYVVGVVQSSNNYKNINIFEDMGDLGVLEASNSAENETYYVVYGKSSSSNNAYLFGNSKNTGFADTDNFAVDTINNLNNGLPYLVFNGKPLITVAPTSIDLSSALTDDFVNGTMEFLDSEGNSKIENNKILLYYFDLIDNGSANYYNDKRLINTINLNDLILKNKINITPKIGARIKVTSSDNSVLTILVDGNIELKKEGIVTLTFSSIINPSVKAEIIVVVKSIPTEYEIYKNSTLSANSILTDNHINIIKGESKFIYEKYLGNVIINNTNYAYNVSNSVRASLIINKNDGNIKINNKDFDENNALTFDNLQPLILSATAFNDEESYTIGITPYLLFEINNIEYLIKLDDIHNFEIFTKQGASSINLNITDATISKEEDLIIETLIETDTQINEIDVEIEVKNQNGEKISLYDEDGNKIQKGEILEFISSETGVNYLTEENGSIKLTLTSSVNEFSQFDSFIVKFNPNIKIEKDVFVTVKLISNNVSQTLNLTIIPQRITSIVANNYKSDNDGWKVAKVVRPGVPNMIVIDIAPETAYYEYLEITDTHSSEKLSFIQFDSFNPKNVGLEGSKALSEMDESSSDGYGIKLKKHGEAIYVYTILDSSALLNSNHVIKITAYSSSGYILGQTNLSLTSLMFPTVILDYVNEKGQVEISCDSRQTIVQNTTDLAIGVEAKIKATTYNIDDVITWKTNIENVYVEAGKDGYYYVKFDMNKIGINSLLNETLIVTAIVTKTTNGIIETDSANLNFTLRKWTLNGVSIKTNRASSNNRLSGVVGKEENYEFYFNSTDISVYLNNKYWNTNYVVDYSLSSTIPKDASYEEKVIIEINNLLKELNNYDSAMTLQVKLNNSTIKTVEFEPVESGYIYNEIDKLVLSRENNQSKILVKGTVVNNYEMIVNSKYNYSEGVPVLDIEGIYSTSNSFGINFTADSTEFNYTPIKDEIDFKNMVEGEYYILVDDLVLTNYQTNSLKIAGFDGNGHTITIKSFDYSSIASASSDGAGYFGLFKEVYADAIVKNLTVRYEIDGSVDLTEFEIEKDQYYTEIYFGGIASINNSIITNCVVEGKLNLTATRLNPSRFYLAGITCENRKTGYITNTTSKVSLSAASILGGVVCDNQGKIVSSQFNGTISAYSSSLLSDQINTAGFAVSNSGEISMCFVGSKTLSLSFDTAGSMGGFVYSNSGTIYDCYLSNVSFSSRGKIAGFVYTSTGKVFRCYVYSLSTLQGDRSKDAFCYEKTSGRYQDCYFIMQENFNSTVDGVESISILDMLKEDKYSNFNFSEDNFGVWSMTNTGPALNSCYTLQGEKPTIEDGDKITFIVSGSREIPYLIYNENSFKYYMALSDNGNLYGYYRIIADIDLSNLTNNPISSDLTFMGQLEGNNMKISGYDLYSSTSNSIGLFKEIKQTNQKNSFINNLILEPGYIRASNVSQVGCLAGVIDSGYIYNIRIDADSMVVLGKNAVGGLAGVIKGEFIINGIESNVGANATFRSAGSKINIYTGKFNTGSSMSNNLSSVSYAGAIAGIVEGYDNRFSSEVYLDNYYKISNCYVYGLIYIGETVGGAFGYVGERAMVSNITFEASSSTFLKAVYYSGGIVGENRGIVANSVSKSSTITYGIYDASLVDSSILSSFAIVNGGIVAVNYGGLIYNCTNENAVVSKYHLATVGGICGRNSYGTLVKVKNTGLVYGLFAGGITGSDYTRFTLTNTGNATGSVSDGTKYALPSKIIDYSKIKLDNTTISSSVQYQNIQNLDNWFEKQYRDLDNISKSLSNFYSYTLGNTADETSYNYKQVLGSIIAITDATAYNYNVLTSNLALQYNAENESVIENKNSNILKCGNDLNNHLYQNGNDIKFYYFVSVLNATYDFWNLSNGYNGAFVKIVD